MTPEELNEIRGDLIDALQDVARFERKLGYLVERLRQPGVPQIVMTDPIGFNDLGAKFQEAQKELNG